MARSWQVPEDDQGIEVSRSLRRILSLRFRVIVVHSEPVLAKLMMYALDLACSRCLWVTHTLCFAGWLVGWLVGRLPDAREC